MGIAKENASGERYQKQIPLAYWSPKARIVYDGTVRFSDRFLDKRERTVDQMVQAARPGKQNISNVPSSALRFALGYLMMPLWGQRRWLSRSIYKASTLSSEPIGL